MSTVQAHDREGGVRLLSLDRPPANAIDGTVLADLSGALEDSRTDDAVRASVITGGGKSFSDGLDLPELPRDGESRA